MSSKHYPFCSILPPYMLKAIAQNGNPAQKSEAMDNLALSERLRGQREIIGPTLAALRSNLEAVASTTKHRFVYDAKHQQQLPGALVRQEGSPASKDVEVNE